MGSSPGANLFGSARMWWFLITLVVGFTIITAITTSINNGRAQQEQQDFVSHATEKSATDYCVSIYQGEGSNFTLLNTSAQKVDETSYRVTITYETSVLGKQATLNQTCFLWWTKSGWRIS